MSDVAQLTESARRLQRNKVGPDYPCSGEVIQLDEFSTKYVRVARCSVCGTEFRYEADF